MSSELPARQSWKKSVACLLDDETIGKIFESCKTASLYFHVDSKSIRKVLDKPNRTCSGRKWITYEPSKEEQTNMVRKQNIGMIDKNGLIVATFAEITQAAEELQCNRSNITKALQKPDSITHGFHFRHLTEDEAFVECPNQHQACALARASKGVLCAVEI